MLRIEKDMSSGWKKHINQYQTTSERSGDGILNLGLSAGNYRPMLKMKI